jgi:Tfp pilus assembly protein PilO
MKKKFILTAGLGMLIILILSAGLFFFGFDISGKSDQIREIKSEIALRSKIINSLSAMRNDINMVQPYILGINNMLPTKDQLINFSKELDMTASQNKINLTSNFSGEDTKFSGELKWIGLTAAAEGDFNNLINFLKSIENSRYSVKLENIDFSEKDKKFKMLLNGKVFYF